MMLLPSRRRRCRATLLAIAFAVASTPSFAARATPLEATVFVRLIGHIRVLRGEDERVWREQLLDLREVEVGTGSGFIISAQGWIVTNHHVIRGEKFTALIRGQKLEVSIDVVRIEVVLPSDSPGQSPRRYAAFVYAVDQELDIALLRVSAADLPYVGLGDSDVVVPGDPMNAVGYPFGGMLDLEKVKTADATPAPSVSTGALSALRSDSAGERRYLQLSATLNPGNSGGPIVDSEGYAIGVAQLRVDNASAIGFAVPINRVKRLLQSHGIDSSLPVDLLAAGGFIVDPAKGLSVHVPVGFEDRSPVRLRLDATSSGRSTRAAVADGRLSEDLALRIDRVATGESVEQLERALLTGGLFERFHAVGDAHRLPSRTDTGRRVLAGHASGSDSTGDQLKLVYTIVDLGKEKIVARYTGRADLVAANRSLLHASLAALEANPLLTAEVARGVQANWISTIGSAPARFNLPTVDGWVVEPGAPWQCAAGPQPAAALTMSPLGDFTVALRAAWHSASVKDVTSAARKCSPQPGGFGETSYVARAAAWGVTYQIDGVFVQFPGSGVWQLEMITPVEKGRFVSDVFAEWIKAIRQ
jgi:S1-C subfamily serine protease